MKTVDLAKEHLSVEDLLTKARGESVLLQDASGERFLLSPADEFASEVELLRTHHDFLTFLDSCKGEEKTISLEEVEKRLR
jgi:hypothetical protein